MCNTLVLPGGIQIYDLGSIPGVPDPRLFCSIFTSSLEIIGSKLMGGKDMDSVGSFPDLPVITTYAFFS